MRIYVKNSKNVQLELSEYNGFALTDVQGLSPAPSNVNITKTAGGDGSIFNSAMIPQRNIVLALYVLPNIEAHRNALYAFFVPNSVITLLISTGTRTAQISGVVESFDGTFFTAAEMFTISILCPQPFFENQTAKTKTLTAGSNAVTNSGDYACGFTASLTVAAGGSDVVISDGVNTLTIDGDTLQTSDVLTISTVPGAVEVKKGTTSLVNLITLSGGFPKLSTGNNTITVTNAAGSMSYTELYGGL